MLTKESMQFIGVFKTPPVKKNEVVAGVELPLFWKGNARYYYNENAKLVSKHEWEVLEEYKVDDLVFQVLKANAKVIMPHGLIKSATIYCHHWY